MHFGYEASVCGGIPIIQSLRNDYVGDRITNIMGIINGSTNYILSKMQLENLDFDSVLKTAKELGYVEADPSADIEGYDARSKLIILTRLCYGKQVKESEVYTKGISQINEIDMNEAKAMDCSIKLLAYSSLNKERNEINMFVSPVYILYLLLLLLI